MEQALRYMNFKRLILEERLRVFGLAFFAIIGFPVLRLGS